MKLTQIATCLLLHLALTTLGQVPEKLSYQALITNSDHSLIADSEIAIKIAILQYAVSGTAVYEEIHRPITSPTGSISIHIGDGKAVRGSFTEIDWSDGPFFIETAADISGGASFKLLATSQLLSVPYALHAKTADRITGDYDYVLRAKAVPFERSREAMLQDIGNIIQCTSDAVLSIPENFKEMQIGDIINLEAHNGAILRVETSKQVELNYITNGEAIFESATGNVRFGLLRKIKDNAYIISGQ